MVEAVLIGRDAARAVACSPRRARLIGRLARATISAVHTRRPAGAAAHALLPDGSEVVVLLAGLVDLEKECARVSTELAQLEKQLGALEQRLANESFVSRAKPEIVEAERREARRVDARAASSSRARRGRCAEADPALRARRVRAAGIPARRAARQGAAQAAQDRLRIRARATCQRRK